MEFPIYQTTPQEAPMKLRSALGVNKINNSEFNAETKILLLEIESAELLKYLTPDFDKLKNHIMKLMECL